MWSDDELWCTEDVSSGFCFGVHIRELEEEVKLLKNLSHPNIVLLWGVCYVPKACRTSIYCKCSGWVDPLLAVCHVGRKPSLNFQKLSFGKASTESYISSFGLCSLVRIDLKDEWLRA
ncbi:hypothetical protein ACSBR2_010345 [Camellia fascicularis]